jgi:methylenetetrahydrofolate--tRNA-(uracil-5-)-methyltransferase
MNVNFGLFPPLLRAPHTRPVGMRLRGADKTADKKRALCLRAFDDLESWLAGAVPAAAE